MVSTGPKPRRETHTVFNQAPPLVDYNLFSSDAVLCQAVEREGAGWALPRLTAFGEILGRQDVIALGFQANDNPPVLHTHDRCGNRIDEVKFHPAWHELMRIAVDNQVHNLPWCEAQNGAHVARAALLFLAGQNEAGHGCPISMTYAAVPTLRKQPEIAAEWLPRIQSRIYDSSFRPAAEKAGVLLGMAMTEKQGGSDVRANTTSAQPVKGGGPGKEYLVVGHKWFCSAPMNDAFLVLAQAPGGLSCFLMPRWTPDGVRNRIFIQRLKNKLGNRSNASSEVEFDGALAWLIGEEGRGVPTIIEMVNHTRLDCTLSSAALMRQALVQAVHHARHRSAFGRRLIEQPLMRSVLADLAIESEAATVLAMRLARAYDARQGDESEDFFRRIATAVAKYWVCKRAPYHVSECLECIGGNGYVEESIMPRLFRESPLNSIWEGSGNVICLDVLRAITTEPRCIESLLAEMEQASGANSILDRAIEELKAKLRTTIEESAARRLVELMALVLQGSLLARHAPPVVADAFCASRLGGDWGHAFGTLPPEDHTAILDRVLAT
ncbi:MAG TPA: isovaleryl-CoA dehydrogenase [Candidatus Obscuribacterales bacterium]